MYANDEFFADAHNLIKPTSPTHDPASYGPRGKTYDGWETRRRNAPGGAPLSDAETGAVLLPGTRLLPGTEHRLRVRCESPLRLARLDIDPDGGSPGCGYTAMCRRSCASGWSNAG